jgi:hypothetical protein
MRVSLWSPGVGSLVFDTGSNVSQTRWYWGLFEMVQVHEARTIYKEEE